MSSVLFHRLGNHHPWQVLLKILVHMIISTTIGGRDVVYIKQHQSSPLSTAYIKSYVKDIGDQRFCDSESQPIVGPFKSKDKVADPSVFNNREIQGQFTGVPYLCGKEVLSYLDDRCRVHKETIEFCKDVLQRKSVDWNPVFRNDLSQPIRHLDLVGTVGGDGTLLQASHLMDDSIPVIGVNSDPTQAEEVKEFRNEFDATRSTGYLCAATAANFERMLFGQDIPSTTNHQPLPTYALNDVLVAHPCPAVVSCFSFRIKRVGKGSSSLVNGRSSGLRVSTAAGFTAAMLSAGGFLMPILCRDLQYMVREPILPDAAGSHLMHGVLKPDESIHFTWHSKDGVVYIDGSHVFYSLQHGDTIEISSEAPMLKVFLPTHLLS